ncbi:hypothetical protein N305_02995, partial [Manacus vitellinus]
FGTLMESSSTLLEISIPRGALENKIMVLWEVKLDEQHGPVGALDDVNSHCVLDGSSDIPNAGQDLTFLNTYKNV